MKRNAVITIIALLAFDIDGLAQGDRWTAGFGLTYSTSVDRPGVNLNVSYRVKGNFFIGPDFSAMLQKRIHRYTRLLVHTEVEYNFNAHQLFEIRDQFYLYPLGGINISRITFKNDNEKPQVEWVKALNAGFGGEVRLKRVALFMEGKYVTKIRKYDFTAGILFPI